MRKLFIVLAILTSAVVQAQDKFNPEIKQGSKLTYMVNINGQDIPLTISYDSIATDYLKMGWTIQDMGSGAWITKKNSIENGSRGWWDEPAPGMDTELSDDQTILMLSRSQWKSLQDEKKFDYDMQTFSPMTATEQQFLKIDNKVVDALLVQGQNGSTRLWVLNNPSLPIILKIEGNTMGPDLGLHSIE
jgi:hypothetical protein